MTSDSFASQPLKLFLSFSLTTATASLSLTCPSVTMEVALRQPARLLQTPSNRLLRQPQSLRLYTTLNRTPRPRHVSTTPRRTAPESLFSLGSGSGGHGGIPTTYFANRNSLPANTVIRFVPQQTAWIVERMGKFHRILEPGLAVLIPFLDRISYVKSLKESAIEIPSQNAITADNVTLELDGVLYTRVFDAFKARYASLPVCIGRGVG